MSIRGQNTVVTFCVVKNNITGNALYSVLVILVTLTSLF